MRALRSRVGVRWMATHDLRKAAVNVPQWRAEHIASFAPPICNKLMHKDFLSVMFVGGPNTRTDFHLDHSSESARGRLPAHRVQRLV